MYEIFRDEVLYRLRDLDTDTLARISETMGVVASGYSFWVQYQEKGYSFCSDRKRKFLEIAATYVIVRKTEGIKQGTIYHFTRVLKLFIEATPKK